MKASGARSGHVSRSWFYRFCVLMVIVGLVVVGSLVVLLVMLPRIAETWGLSALEKRWGKGTQLVVEKMSPWGMELERIHISQVVAGVDFEVRGARVRYRPGTLWRKRKLDSVHLDQVSLDVGLDALLEGAVSPAHETKSELQIPAFAIPFRHLSVNQFLLDVTSGETALRGEAFTYGSESPGQWDQMVLFEVAELNFDSHWLGTIHLPDYGWRLSGGWSLDNPVRALNALLPDWKQGVDANMEFKSLTGESNFSGTMQGIDNMSALFETGTGSLQYGDLDIDLTGVAGALTAEEAPLLDPTLRVHALIESLKYSAWAETDAFAVELTKNRDEPYRALVGPLSLRSDAGSFVGNVEAQVADINTFPKPGDIHLRVDADHLDWDRSPLGVTGNGMVDLELFAGSQYPRATLDWNFQKVSYADGAVEGKGEGWVKGSTVGEETGLVGKLEWGLSQVSGVWGPTFLSNAEMEGAVSAGDLPMQYPLDVAGQWEQWLNWDWMGYLEANLVGSARVRVGEVMQPGAWTLEHLNLELNREVESLPVGELVMKLTAGSMVYSGARVEEMQFEGKLSRETGDISGILSAGAESPVRMQLAYNREGDSVDHYNWTLEVPEASLDRSAVLGIADSSLEGSKLTGDFEASVAGRYQWGGSWNGSARTSGRALNFVWEEQEMEVEGAELNLIIEDLTSLMSPPGQQFRADSLRKGDLLCENLHLQFRLMGPGRVKIEALEGDVFGGRIRLEPFIYDSKNPDMQMIIHVNQIDLQRVSAMIETFPGSMKGRVNGVLRVRWTGTEMEFGKGHLEMAPQTEGVLRLNLDDRKLDPSEPAYDFLKNLAQTQTAVESLRHVSVQNARLDLFNEQNPLNPTQLRLQGVSLSINPTTPVDLTINLNEDVEESLSQLLRVLLSLP